MNQGRTAVGYAMLAAILPDQLKLPNWDLLMHALWLLVISPHPNEERKRCIQEKLCNLGIRLRPFPRGKVPTVNDVYLRQIITSVDPGFLKSSYERDGTINVIKTRKLEYFLRQNPNLLESDILDDLRYRLREILKGTEEDIRAMCLFLDDPWESSLYDIEQIEVSLENYSQYSSLGDEQKATESLRDLGRYLDLLDESKLKLCEKQNDTRLEFHRLKLLHRGFKIAYNIARSESYDNLLQEVEELGEKCPKLCDSTQAIMKGFEAFRSLRYDEMVEVLNAPEYWMGILFECLWRVFLMKRITRPVYAAPTDIVGLIKTIRKHEPNLPFAQALRKHSAKISIWQLLETETPSSIRQIAQKIGLVERQTWEHIKELREWGILSRDFHSRETEF